MDNIILMWINEGVPAAQQLVSAIGDLVCLISKVFLTWCQAAGSVVWWRYKMIGAIASKVLLIVCLKGVSRANSSDADGWFDRSNGLERIKKGRVLYK